MGRVVFGVIGVVVRRSVVLLVFTVAVRGQTPQSGSAVHLTPRETQRKSQQDEYSICVAMSLYAKGIHWLEVGSLSSALGSWKECTQLTGGGVLVSSPETGGFAGWCVWVFSELVQPLSHGDCQLRGQPPHKDAAGGDKSIKYSRFHFSSEASANTFPQPFPTAAEAEDCFGLGARTSLRGGFSPISRHRNQMPAIAGKLNPSDDFCQTKTRNKRLVSSHYVPCHCG